MKRYIRYFSIFIMMIIASTFLFLSCSGKKSESWKSPADEAQLMKLEAATEYKNISKKRRAELFFLWGQELASSIGSEGSSPETLDRAIGAFMRVVDLNEVLVNESRFNLEILWRQKEDQEKQDQQDQQDKKDQQGQQGQQDKKDSGGEQDKKSAEQEAKEQTKDISALVRDKEQASDLDDALKAEDERRAAKQTTQTGKIVPVEKDW